MSESLNSLYKRRLECPNNIIAAYLNINSIRNKLLGVSCLLQDKVDVLTIAESKLDSSFPTKQFHLDGYNSPYRLDISKNSGGILIYVADNIPSKLKTDFNIPNNLQIIPLELNFRKQKWLYVSVYRPPKDSLGIFLEFLSSLIDYYSNNFENILVMGDMNAEVADPRMTHFVETHNMYSHIKEKTCWKSPDGSCIDLVLSNKKHSFIHNGTAETGLSDHHSLVYTIFKTKFSKDEPRKITYRSYRNFKVDAFFSGIKKSLPEVSSYSDFHKIFLHHLDKHAPVKTRLLRANNQPHVNKTMRKAIMIRSRLKNKAILSSNNQDWKGYKVQRNKVVNLNRNLKRTFLNNAPLKGKNSFWKSCKMFFSEKSRY